MNKFSTVLIFTLCLFFYNNTFAQPGCTDTQATNYNPAATQNDGSCEYATTNYVLNQIAVLPTTLVESSGLAYFDHQLWTHNDANNEDKIYQIDTTNGTILNTVIIANSSNTDWEDLAEDETHLYIGDFGNNNGDRTDLKIYKVPKSQLASGIATATVIEFSFSDQTDFTTTNNNTDYDCEAFFFYQDSLHLFSKNWVNQKTRHYVMPASEGNHVAQLRDSMDVQGLITGADISDEGVVALIGYNFSGINIMWLCFDYEGTNFFSGNRRKISLGLALANSQTEGIAFRQNGYGYVSSEKFASLDAKLLSFQSAQWTNEMTVGLGNLENKKAPFQFYPNPFSKNVNILLEESGPYEISLLDSNGKLIKKGKQLGGGVVHWNVDTLLLESGIYFLTVKNAAGFWTEQIVFVR